MKMLLGFSIGTTFALLLVLVMTNNTTTVSADAAASTTTYTDDLNVTGLMPDVGQIYNAALGDPYRQVETEITDPDIANYFHRYMEDTGLDKFGAE
jgi:hypothetical protein